MADEWISKKELLSEAHISYGQLYRWKRKGLIPETWFIRRSTFTGQETFFPRSAILDRIRWIQSMKPEIPLDDLAQRIQEPSSSGPLWPLDVLWEQGKFSSRPPINIDLSTSMSEYDFVFLIIVYELQRRGFPSESHMDALAFVKQISVQWLEEPQATLFAIGLAAQWYFLVSVSPQALWFGSQSTPLSVSIAECRSRARDIFQRTANIL